MRWVVIIFLFLGTVGWSQKPLKILFDAKITNVKNGQKIPIATVELFEDDQSIHKTVTQNGRFNYTLKEDKLYKIVFTKNGYVTKFLLIETNNIPDNVKKTQKVRVEISLFQDWAGLEVDFLKERAMGIARYEEIYKRIKWDDDYTRIIEEQIINATLDYHKKKELGIIK